MDNQTAVFYDFENVSRLLKKNSPDFFKNVIEAIKESSVVGNIVFQRGYLRKNSNGRGAAKTAEGFGVQYCEVVPLENTQRKNLVDFRMTIDITEFAIMHDAVSVIVLVTGDGDFGFLCDKIKSLGKKIVIASFPAITHCGLLRICDDWVDVTGSYKHFGIPYLFGLRKNRLGKPPENLDETIGLFENDPLLYKIFTKTGANLNAVKEIIDGAAGPVDYQIFGIPGYPQFLCCLFREKKLIVTKCNSVYKIMTVDSRLKNGEEIFEYNPGPDIFSKFAGIDSRYSKKRFDYWYEFFYENPEFLGEIEYYISLLKNAEITGGEKRMLPRRKCVGVIRDYVKETVKKFGFSMSEKDVRRLERMLRK
jgi:hypothetical protein